MNAGIVITTRNREQDLHQLFALLAAQPRWQNLPLWIHDDASDAVSAEYWQTIRQRARVICNAQRTGYIVNRNYSNTQAPFDLIFSLDDDSCFVDPEGPDRAIAYLHEHPNVAALAFPLVDSLTPAAALDLAPYPCFTYVGCAHLIRQELFVKLGGYRCDFIHQGEESELCARIWAAGYEVHAFPACRVHHWVSPASRDYRRMGFYGSRNRVLNHLLHTPLLWLPFELVRSLASYTRLSWQTRLPLTHLHGLMAGMQHGVMHWHQRQPLPLALYRLLMALPISA